MNIDKHIRNLLFVLIVIYSAQGTLYAVGTIISQSILAVVLLISGVYFIKALFLKKQDRLFFNAWTALLLLNILGMVFTGSFDYPHHFNMFKGILMSLLPFYPFYFFARKNLLQAKHLLWFFALMLPIASLQFYNNQSRILEEAMSENVVNNMAYTFVGLLPFVFLIRKNKVFAYAAMALIVFFVIQGAKRGAIVTGAAGLVLFIYYQMRTVDKKYRLRGIVLILIATSAMVYFAYSFFESNEFLRQRLQQMQEGNVSGRDVIYANIFNTWADSNNMLHTLFGYGFASSLVLSGSGVYAHNDWLELLSNFGLLGGGVYLVLFFVAFRYTLRKEWTVDKRLLMLTVVLIWFLTTLFSMSYTADGGYVKAMLLAYLVGSGSKEIV